MHKDSVDAFSLETSFKQFFLETERLEFAYKSLSALFEHVQKSLEESHSLITSKVSELNFVSHYLESILHTISQAILFIDLNGMVTTCNPAAEIILNVSARSILFHRMDSFFEDSFLGFSILDTLYTKQCPPLIIQRWKRSDGVTLDLEVEPSLVSMDSRALRLDHSSSANTYIQGLLIIIRNVTEIRRLQEESNRNDRLKELGGLAAHLAHEIRNPLGGIKGFASLLVNDLQERPELQKMASQILEGTENLNRLVTNILTYTRPYKTVLTYTNLSDLIDEVFSLLVADKLWKSHLRFSKHLIENNICVSIDTQLIKSALLNLFINAIQAMPCGGELSVTIDKTISDIVLKIQDTGIGIPPEDLNQIFSPFFTTKDSGTGLGLAEVQKVIQAHHGIIEVESKVNQGTSFIIKIPITRL